MTPILYSLQFHVHYCVRPTILTKFAVWKLLFSRILCGNLRENQVHTANITHLISSFRNVDRTLLPLRMHGTD